VNESKGRSGPYPRITVSMVFRLARAKKNVIQGCSMINEGDAELLAIWMILQLFWGLSKRTSVAACRWISAGRSPWIHSREVMTTS
jgi:N-acyl-D-aspartate/D-glutamate deacylase